MINYELGLSYSVKNRAMRGENSCTLLTTAPFCCIFAV